MILPERRASATPSRFGWPARCGARVPPLLRSRRRNHPVLVGSQDLSAACARLHCRHDAGRGQRSDLVAASPDAQAAGPFYDATDEGRDDGQAGGDRNNGRDVRHRPAARPRAQSRGIFHRAGSGRVVRRHPLPPRRTTRDHPGRRSVVEGSGQGQAVWHRRVGCPQAGVQRRKARGRLPGRNRSWSKSVATRTACAISNHRLLDKDSGQVRFTDTDYRADPPDSSKTLTLTATEFIRRFLLHVLPTGFHRIRYYGFLGARHRRETLTRCRQLLGSPASLTMPTDATSRPDYRDHVETLTRVSLGMCPACHHGEMILIERLSPARHAVPLNPDTS